MNKKAVIYARQSSGSDDFSESVAVQIANCRKLTAELQLEILKVFSDLNISGKTYPEGWENLAAADSAFQKWVRNNSSHRQFRPALGRLIAILPEVDYLVVDDVTRLYRPLSRSFLESAINERLIEHHVKILQVKGGLIDLAQFDHQLVTMLKNQINDEQIAKQRQRSIEVFNRIRDSGLMPTGITAFALNYDKASKRFLPDPEKSEVVKYVFEKFLAGEKYGKIIGEINTRWKNFFPSCFWEKNLYEILRKPIYAGFQYNTAGELIPNCQGPSLVTLDDFIQAQKMLEQKRMVKKSSRSCEKSVSRKYFLPLSGILRCGVCGSRLVAAIEKDNIDYFCRRGSLCREIECRQSRIRQNCSENSLCSLLDAVRTLLGEALIKRCKLELDCVERVAEKNVTDVFSCHESRIEVLCREFIRGSLPEHVFRSTLKSLSGQNPAFYRYSDAESDTTDTDQLRVKMPLSLSLLLTGYRKNCLAEHDFKMLLREAIHAIYVYKDHIAVVMPEKKLLLKRIVCKRQNGFLPEDIQRLRRNYLGKINSLCRKFTLRS